MSDDVLVISLLTVIHCRLEGLTCVSPILNAFIKCRGLALLLLHILGILASKLDPRPDILIEVIGGFSQFLHPSTSTVKSSVSACVLLDLLLNSEDGSSTVLRNVSEFLPDYTAYIREDDTLRSHHCEDLWFNPDGTSN
jgi:hypothetical protein